MGMLFVMDVFVQLMGVALVKYIACGPMLGGYAGIYSVGDVLKTSDSKVVIAISERRVIYLRHRFLSSRKGQETLDPRKDLLKEPKAGGREARK